MKKSSGTIFPCISLILCSCGGGGDSAAIAPAPPSGSESPFSAGRYTATLSDSNTAVDGGFMAVESNGDAFFSGQQYMGFGTWARSGNEAAIMLTMLTRGGLQEPGISRSPGADPANTERHITVAESSTPDSWIGAGGSFELQKQTLTPLINIPRNWAYQDVIPFDHQGDNVQYSLQIDIDTAGELSGFDSNGCNFTGRLTERTDNVALYDATITATNCGAMSRFIEADTYVGYAYIQPAGNGQPENLIISGIRKTRKVGISLSLFPR